MKRNKQHKNSNYVAFSHFHGTAVNNSGLYNAYFKTHLKLDRWKSEEPYTLRFPSFILQYIIATPVLTAGAIIPAGFTLPYWLLYAIIFTGISCNEEIFKIKNVHISLLTILPLFPLVTTDSSPPYLPALFCLFLSSAKMPFPPAAYPGVPRSSSSFASSSIALSPPCVKLVIRTL